jgi:hypothetical protein
LVKGVQAKLAEVPVTVSPLAVVVGVPPTVQVLLRVAVLDPVVVGEAATAIVQVALPPARLATPQVSLERVKSPGFAPASTGAEQVVAEPVPELVNVNV